MKMRRFLAAVIAAWLMLGGVAIGEAAQTPPAIERLGIALWPEYDQPSVLVIYRAAFAPDVSYPAQVTLPIPAGVGEPFAVAVRAPDGSLLYAEGYERTVQGDWALITFLADTPDVQLEYYDSLERQGDERQFAFTWPGGFDIGSLSYEVQHPVGAADMTLEPPPDSQLTRNDGLLYSLAELGPLAAGETRQVAFRYTRPTDTLSVDVAQAAIPAVAPALDAEPSLTPYLLWALGLLGLALVAAGGVLVWRSRRAVTPAAKRSRARKPRRPQADEPSLDAGRVFCHQCGAQGAVNDAYCRRCGAKLRN